MFYLAKLSNIWVLKKLWVLVKRVFHRYITIWFYQQSPSKFKLLNISKYILHQIGLTSNRHIKMKYHIDKKKLRDKSFTTSVGSARSYLLFYPHSLSR